MSKKRRREVIDDVEENEGSVLEIDIYQLEKEWANQPKLYFKFARRLGEARNAVDEAKAELELTKAEIERDIRDEPGRFGLAKVTDKAVEAAIPRQQGYQIALSTLNERKKDVAYLDAMVESLDHRKRALENTVSLFLGEYYSKPRSPKGKEEEVQRMREDNAFRRKEK